MQHYISIEKNIEVFELYKDMWSKLGIYGIRANSMTEGIKKAIEIEKSKFDCLLFIDIVADDVDYMAQLKILSHETNAPILIATSNYNEDEHHKALINGADFYGAYCDAPEQNINAVFASISSIERRAKKKKTPSKVITYNGILLAPQYRNNIFINDVEIELTKTEFDLLHYFMKNRGITLTVEQIYNRVWKNERTESIDTVVKSAIGRLRKKINGTNGEPGFIENIWGVGFRFPVKHES
ncbi:MAG: response regulator transcription factor [Defluviitaleaceae bacterium]|nr:response regulator transcription factor [Defluviitaleaceae bacterium]